MSRKSFIIWGLVIIQLNATLVAILLYLAFSKIIDAEAIAPIPRAMKLLVVFIGFGIILSLRFKTIGRRKRNVAFALPFYALSLIVGSALAGLYSQFIIPNSGAFARFFQALGEWQHVNNSEDEMFTIKEKLDFILILLPAFYLINWGLFALLAFGSLDPRKPSNNRAIQFFKTGFQRQSGSAVRTDFTEVAHG